MEKTDQQWHSYENKQERPIRVMVRNLHSACKAEVDELKSQNFKILNAEPKKKKTPEGLINLPLFVLTFDRLEDIKKMYNIQYINHMKIRIEAIKANKLIPQCRRCQRYGHTLKYCNRNPS